MDPPHPRVTRRLQRRCDRGAITSTPARPSAPHHRSMADDVERGELLAVWRDTIQAADLAERLAAAALEAAQQADLRSETANEIAELAERAAESAARAAQRARTAAEEAGELARLARERAPDSRRGAELARKAEADAGEAFRSTES